MRRCLLIKQLRYPHQFIVLLMPRQEFLLSSAGENRSPRIETRSVPNSLVATLSTSPSISLIPQLDCTDHPPRRAGYGYPE